MDLEACRSTIHEFIAAKNLQRLKELLPVIFDVYGVHARETQKSILAMCSLTPVVETAPWSQVTFQLTTESTSSSSPDLPCTPSASERSWPSSEESESD